jgi:hypothetical protein
MEVVGSSELAGRVRRLFRVGLISKVNNDDASTPWHDWQRRRKLPKIAGPIALSPRVGEAKV